MKTFGQWIVWEIKEKLGILSPSLYYYGDNMGDKSSNSKLKKTIILVLIILNLAALYVLVSVLQQIF